MPRIIQETSSTKVQYELRAAKQVERRMLIESLQALSLAGFPITDYQYTGFGAIYFVDFILFHKILGIREMLSIEGSPKVHRRAVFNRPYDAVRVHLGLSTDVIPTLSE